MLVEKLESFKTVLEKAKEENVNVQSNEFIVYVSILNALEGDNIFTDEELAELIDRIIDINIETDEYTHCSIADIVDYCIDNYEDIDEMSNTDILEDICC